MSGRPARGCRVEDARLPGADLGQSAKCVCGVAAGVACAVGTADALLGRCVQRLSRSPASTGNPHAGNEGHYYVSQTREGEDWLRVTSSSGRLAFRRGSKSSSQVNCVLGQGS